MDGVFYLGPLGGMVPLAVPEAGVTNSPVMMADSNRGVAGKLLTFKQGVRREWALQQAHLYQSDVSTLTGFYDGSVVQPLRIIDPLLVNRARMATSLARKSALFSGGTTSWTTNGGITQTLYDPGLPFVSYTDVEGRAVSFRADTAIRWTAAANKVLWPNGSPSSTSRVDPVLPGETVTFSLYTRQTGSGTHSVALNGVTATGSTAVVQSVTGLTASTSWTRRVLTYTAPEDGSVIGVFPTLGASANSVILDIGMVQLESGDTATNWVAGYGAPEVDITSFTTTSQQYPLTTVDLVATEL